MVETLLGRAALLVSGVRVCRPLLRAGDGKHATDEDRADGECEDGAMSLSATSGMLYAESVRLVFFRRAALCVVSLRLGSGALAAAC